MMKTLLSMFLFITLLNPVDSMTTSKLHYLVRQPKIKSEKPPVIVLLHGAGSNEQDLFSFASQLPDKYLVVSVRAPYVAGPESYLWYQVDFSTGKPVYDVKQEEESRNALIKFLQQLQSEHPYNPQQVYLCGFSQGAIMSYSVALTRPDLVTGIAAMSGRLLEEIKPKISAKEIKHLKVFVSHGTRDNVLPVKNGTDAVAYLRSIGIEPAFKEYAAGHEINKDMFRDLLEWLRQ